MERTIKPEILKNELAGKYILDVRRSHDHIASSEQIAGTNRRVTISPRSSGSAGPRMKTGASASCSRTSTASRKLATPNISTRPASAATTGPTP